MWAVHSPRVQSASTAPMLGNGKMSCPRLTANKPTSTTASSASLTRFWPAGSSNVSFRNASHTLGATFNYARGVADSQGPTLSFSPASTVTATLDGSRVSAGQQFSFFHDGTQLELYLQNNAQGILIKIDGGYFGFDPIITASNSFIKLDFGTRAIRRIDLIGYKTAFAGVYTAPEDSIWAAPISGPRVICVGDSFTTPSANGWVNWFADCMGWEDVWTSGVGGTGFCATASGTKPTFGARLDADVVAYRPDLVYLFGGINDIGFSPTEAAAAVESAVSFLKRKLPSAVIVGGMNTAKGVESWNAAALNVHDAMADAFRRAGGAWLSTLQMPHKFTGPPIGYNTALMDNLVAGRPGNLGTVTSVNGTCGFRINSSSTTADTNLRIGACVEIGTGATRERVNITAVSSSGGRLVYGFAGSLQYAHSAGEPVREVGPAYIAGTGSTNAPRGWGSADLYIGDDGFHPSAAGQRAIGQVNAMMLTQHLREIGRIIT